MANETIRAHKPASGSAVDPVTREVILSGIKSAVDEMDVLIGRAAMSPVIREKKDYFMGYFDARGRMVHVLTSYSGPGLVDPVLERFDVNAMQPGDIYFYNDPYTAKGAVGHLPDIVLVSPFHAPDGELTGFAVAYGHLADIGGLRYGSGAMDARDTFNEGIAYPPMQVGRAGKVDPRFMELLLRNTRCPDLVEGDWRALLAGCQLGIERAQGLMTRWGKQAFVETMEWVIDESAHQMRQILDRELANGVYYAENFADGSAVGQPGIKITSVLTKSDEAMTLDLTGSDDQVDAPLNYLASLNGARLLMLLQLRVIDPTLGSNEGALQNLTRLVVRPGSVVQPNYPAPLNSRAIPRSALIANLAEILAQATGGRVTAPAPSHVVVHFAFMDGNSIGETLGVGQGGRPFGDGPDVVYGAAQRNFPIEQMEASYPVTIEHYDIRMDTGGPGKFRGGCGVRRAIRVHKAGSFSPRLGNSSIPCQGIAGGMAGGMGRVTVVTPGEEPRIYPGVFGEIPIKAGDLVILESSGGGGWGDPLERDIDAVLRDVAERFVSVEQAWDVYGVRIDNGVLDSIATAAGPRKKLAA